MTYHWNTELVYQSTPPTIATKLKQSGFHRWGICVVIMRCH